MKCLRVRTTGNEDHIDGSSCVMELEEEVMIMMLG